MSGFKKFKRTLAAGEEITIDAIGGTFRCIAGDAIFFVKPDGSGKTELQAGIGFRSDQRATIWWILNGSTAQTIEFYIGDGDILDNRLVGNIAISGGLKSAANAAANHAAVALVATVAKVIKAANSARSNIVVQNLGATEIYIGTSAAVTAANGVKIAPGASATLTHAAAVWAICAAAADVRYFEETV